MIRQFVYMVSYCCNRGINGLHRINPLRLFYPKDAAAVERAAAAAVEDFMLLGRNNDKIVSMDEAGRCILYDVAEHAVR
ncbi:hypothetical protein E2562_036838 [Oryza meyeriana var. granulata]|uniref:Uncharacterized protein n=1 Tax=Oryza meyeriana var. granulata TaxID=110450 RepID=A0A6G1E8I8_9ORYZ|nr:hypothetical protein E2562_036838 [Oryza meyeriana var. granulata]